MDFGFSAEELALAARMRALGDEAEGRPQSERLACLARGGALGLPIPPEYGGEGRSLVATALAYESLGERCSDGGVLLAAGAHLFGVALPLLRLGSEAQRAAWLPALSRGEAIGTVAATEAAAGSDVGASATFAEGAEGELRVRGEKRYVTSAETASLFLVFGREREASGALKKGLSAWLVPRGPGVRTGEPWDTAGLRGAGLGSVAFEGAAALPDPPGPRLGRAGAGMAAFQVAMTFERALVLAFRLGAMARQLEQAVRFTRTREVGGTAIARHQAVQHRIAGMRRRLETSRMLVYKAAWALDRGERAQAEACLAKWHLAESALESALDAARLRGGAGFLESSGLPQGALDALGGTFHSGTSDVLATIVARWEGL